MLGLEVLVQQESNSDITFFVLYYFLGSDRMFTDTHCHLYKEYYDNIEEIKEKMDSNNIYRVINNGTEKNSNKEIIEYIDKYEWMYGAIGIHPEEVDNYSNDDILFIENNIKNNKIVAIGEIGLDYHFRDDNKKEQIELFERQLRIAEENNIPVIIHSRDATMDTIDILKKYKVKGVIHSFSGSYEIAKIYIKMGFLLGINGVVTFKNCRLKEVLERIDNTNIILETDSPYLTPVPDRGKKNDPSYILEIAKFVSNIYGISLDELSVVTEDNIKRVFDF